MHESTRPASEFASQRAEAITGVYFAASGIQGRCVTPLVAGRIGVAGDTGHIPAAYLGRDARRDLLATKSRPLCLRVAAQPCPPSPPAPRIIARLESGSSFGRIPRDGRRRSRSDRHDWPPAIAMHELGKERTQLPTATCKQIDTNHEQAGRHRCSFHSSKSN